MQDIQFALAYQIEMRLPLDALSAALGPRWRGDRHRHRPLAGRDWVHRAIFILARTIDHCYGRGGDRGGRRSSNPAPSPLPGGELGDGDDARDIEREIRWWHARRPDAFRPLYFLAADPGGAGRPFPTICYTSTAHGASISRKQPKQNLLVAT